jgi:PadR family transcriptional regulator PadR
MAREMGQQTIVVLKALVSGCKYGFEIVSATGNHTATVYRSLRRLEKLGFVRSNWENASISEESGRPRRRYYGVTRHGSEALEHALETYRSITAESSPAENKTFNISPKRATS